MAQKADGTIIINTKIDISGLEDGGKEIQKSFEKTADSTKSFTKEASAAQKGAEKLNDELLDTSKQAKKAEEKIDRVNETLDDTDSSAASAQKGLGDVFGQMFGASALADVAIGALKEVGEALKDLAIESIQAAADLRAENAQFSETFKELEETATKSLDNIAKDVGISASRMKKSYTKSFAFVKSIGADSEEAMNIANRAMVAAADSAAYYDVTVEQATETLQSFLKGNYENDAALGIAATETTRNAKANELYAKSFDKLSESQKVDVLLAMVEAGNAASGALGQAAREADSWTNVTGELQEAWRQLLGVLGDPILDALTPMLQGISNAIYSIIERSDAQKLRDNFKDYEKAVTEAQAAFTETSTSIETAAAKADYYAGRLYELEQAGLNTVVAQEEYKLVVEELNKIIPGMNLVIDEQTGIVNKNTAEIKANIDAWKKQSTAAALQRRFADVLEAQGEAEANLIVSQAKRNMLLREEEEILAKISEASEGRNTVNQQFMEIQQRLQTDLSLTAEEEERLYAQQDLLRQQLDQIDMTAAEYSATLTENWETQASLNAEITRANDILAEQSPLLQEVQTAYEEYNGANQETSAAVSSAWDRMNAAISATEESVQEVADGYNEARAAAKESVDAQIGLFEELNLSSKKTAGDIINNWEKQRQAFENYSTNLQKAVDMGLDEALVKQLSDGSRQSMEILNSLVTGTGGSIAQINESYKKLDASRQTAADNMALIQSDTLDKLESIKADNEREWGAMAVEVGEAIDQMQAEIDSLTGRTVYVTVRERYIKSSAPTDSTGAAAQATAAAISSYEVPQLAKGAVIPPNAPFMAVLGDQRSGTNIEAPLETIQEAFRSEMGGMLGLLDDRLGELLEESRALRQTVGDIEVGDDTIGAAAGRYNSRLAVMRGNG